MYKSLLNNYSDWYAIKLEKAVLLSDVVTHNELVTKCNNMLKDLDYKEFNSSFSYSP